MDRKRTGHKERRTSLPRQESDVRHGGPSRKGKAYHHYSILLTMMVSRPTDSTEGRHFLCTPPLHL
jgi:hypothetical protein